MPPSLYKMEQALRQAAATGRLQLAKAGLHELQVGPHSLAETTEADLSGNALRVVPPSLLTLDELERLHLGRNSIAVAPDLSLLVALSHLDLSHNDLRAMPAGLDAAPLVCLDMGFNQLTAVDASVRGAAMLEVLGLEHNRIESVAPEISALRRLQTLRLGHNALAELPGQLGMLESLVTLELTGNRCPAPAPASPCAGMAHVTAGWRGCRSRCGTWSAWSIFRRSTTRWWSRRRAWRRGARRTRSTGSPRPPRRSTTAG